MENLVERRYDAKEKLDALHRARGVAVLDGKDFDASLITDAQAEIDALEAAEAESARREREAWIASRAERDAGLRVDLEKVLEQRLAAIDRAEAAALELGVALKALVTHSSDARSIINKLGLTPPIGLTESEVTLRAALRVSAAMKPVVGTKHRFGGISFPAADGPHLPDGTNLTDSWKDAETKKIGPSLAHALSKGSTK